MYTIEENKNAHIRFNPLRYITMFHVLRNGNKINAYATIEEAKRAVKLFKRYDDYIGGNN
jgi:hypothetical protein